jgi:uncharacterized protein GlcG (DUF336 family)
MESTVTKRTISQHAAEQVLAAAVQKAGELGVPSTVVVVDESGALKAAVRMDGAPLISVEAARRKAYTSATSGYPTGGFYDFISGDAPLLRGIPDLPDVCAIGGGIPLQVDGELVGAIGVSGGHYSQDEVIAAGGVDALGGKVVA